MNDTQHPTPPPTSRAIDGDLIPLLPNLRAYARFLTGNRQDADDLLQDTAMRLLAAADRYQQGTNFKAWAFTVMRNRFLNEFIAKRRPTRPIDDMGVDFAQVFPTQTHVLELRDLARQFMKLPSEYRSILVLASGERMSYEEIAVVCNCAVGTVKSRVHRARVALLKLMRDAYEPALPEEDNNPAIGSTPTNGVKSASRPS